MIMFYILYVFNSCILLVLTNVRADIVETICYNSTLEGKLKYAIRVRITDTDENCRKTAFIFILSSDIFNLMNRWDGQQ